MTSKPFTNLTCRLLIELTLVGVFAISSAPAFASSESGDIEWARAESARVLRQNSLSVKVKGLGQRSILAAGGAQFAALWTRDFAFAALGALSFNHVEPVRGGLEALFYYQRADGLIPRRIDGVSNSMRGLLGKVGIHLKPAKELKKAEYRSGLGGTPIDSNSLIAWVTEEYVAKTGDVKFADTVWPKLELAFQWLKTNEDDGLLKQTPFADWKDVTRRDGKVMYSNSLYYRGLVAMKNLATHLGHDSRAQVYANRAGRLKTKIQNEFWDNSHGFFKDQLMVQSEDSYGFFSADGNFFAIIFGIADEAQADSILARADVLLRDPHSGLYANVDRPYPKSYVPFSIRFVGIKGYSDNSYVYPWNTALYAQAALAYPTAENKLRAQRALNALTQTIKKYGFQEAYERGGGPVHRWAHKSEPNFSWFAGLMSLASHEALEICQGQRPL